MRRNGIVHNTKDRLTGTFCFLVYDLNNTAFQGILQCKVIPFTMVEKISGSRSVMLAYLSKIDGLSSIATKENRNNNGH